MYTCMLLGWLIGEAFCPSLLPSPSPIYYVLKEGCVYNTYNSVIEIVQFIYDIVTIYVVQF